MAGRSTTHTTLVGRTSELDQLEDILAVVREGGGAALLIVGDPGIGKSALLQVVVERAPDFQVCRAAGVEGEVDLPYAGLHQLCRSMLDQLAALPEPQADALRVAFGLMSGKPCDRYLVGLAALTLMSEVASAEPLLCLVDDAQWVDAETLQALAFAARRLGQDSVGLLLAGRTRVDDLDLPTLELRSLAAVDARSLLDTVLLGRLDETVRDRVLTESRGNPLALLELSNRLTSAEAATGILPRETGSLSEQIEASFAQRLEALPAETRQLLLLASAEPTGDPLLLLRAASLFGLSAEVADAAEEAGLFEMRERCTFCHPLARSASYRMGTPAERRRAHAALAEATDSDVDADRKAWHRAQSTSTPDEGIAAELEQTSARAKARGGLSAAGAFLERAALLTPDPIKRTERVLTAAEMLYYAGAFASAEKLLSAVETSRLDDLQDARYERLQAEMTLMGNVESTHAQAFERLLAAAVRLEEHDAQLGHAARIDALGYLWNGPEFSRAIAGHLIAPTEDDRDPAGLIAQGWATMLGRGFPAGTDLLREAMVLVRDAPAKPAEPADLQLANFAAGIAKSLWDRASWEALSARSVEVARALGAVPQLRDALFDRAWCWVYIGDFQAAAAAFDEGRILDDALVGEYQIGRSLLDAFHYEHADAIARIERSASRNSEAPHNWDYLRAVACNASGKYDSALAFAEKASGRHPMGVWGAALPELVEAAVRCGQIDKAKAAVELLVPRTQLGGTDWALGLEVRCLALLNDGSDAERLYRDAIERLGRARVRPDLARAHLLYGEWLRRASRRADAREQLRIAHELFEEIGMPGFAERARRELAATGETARKRTDETRADLTAQESQIARLAADGMTNREIGAQLYLSPRTVEYHLRKVYPKLGISSRRELPAVAASI